MKGPKPMDLTGLKVNRLTVIELSTEPCNHGRKWLCRCDCGNVVSVLQAHLRNARTKSCGCAKKGTHTTHGLLSGANRERYAAEYRAWTQMRRRCSERCGTLAFRKQYYERGIRVCERWENDFAAFLDDMGPRPTPAHSLDRKDNDGNYEPSNCRWALPLEQANNRRRTIRAMFRGEKTPIAEIARVTGIPEGNVYGWAKRGYRLKGTELEGTLPFTEQHDATVAHGTRQYKPLETRHER